MRLRDLLIFLTLFFQLSCSEFPLTEKDSAETEGAQNTEDEDTGADADDAADGETDDEKDTVDDTKDYSLPDYPLMKTFTESEVIYAEATDADKESVKNCLSNLKTDKIDLAEFDTSLGNFSFKKLDYEPIRGEFAVMHKDETTTDLRTITLINALEATGSNLHLSLRNARGIYCLKNVDNIGTDISFHLSCGAMLSEYKSWQEVDYGYTDVQASGVYIDKKFKFFTYEEEDQTLCLRHQDTDPAVDDSE